MYYYSYYIVSLLRDIEQFFSHLLKKHESQAFFLTTDIDLNRMFLQKLKANVEANTKTKCTLVVIQTDFFSNEGILSLIRILLVTLASCRNIKELQSMNLKSVSEHCTITT